MAQTVQLNTRINPVVKQRGDAVFSRAVISPSEVVRSVWTYVAQKQRVPDSLLEAESSNADSRIEAICDGVGMVPKKAERMGVHLAHTPSTIPRSKTKCTTSWRRPSMSSLMHPSPVLVDTNVWVACLMGTQPHCEHVTEHFELCVRHNISLLYTPTKLKDVFCVIPKHARRDAIAAGETLEGVSFAPLAWAAVNKITDIATAVPQSLVECELAWTLRGKHADIEDNLQVAAADSYNADYIVTYDARHIAHFAPSCTTPGQLLALLA